MLENNEQLFETSVTINILLLPCSFLCHHKIMIMSKMKSEHIGKKGDQFCNTNLSTFLVASLKLSRVFGRKKLLLGILCSVCNHLLGAEHNILLEYQ